MALIETNNVAWLTEAAKDPVFWEFLSVTFREIVQSEKQAVNVVLWNLNADAFTDVDERASVAAGFRDQVRVPYANFKWSFNNQSPKREVA